MSVSSDDASCERLAIAEAVQAPEAARELNSIGREASRTALRKIMAEAQASGLLYGRRAELAEQFAELLWRDLMLSLLVGVVERPNPREIVGCARDAASAFLQLHPLPNNVLPGSDAHVCGSRTALDKGAIRT